MENPPEFHLILISVLFLIGSLISLKYLKDYSTPILSPTFSEHVSDVYLFSNNSFSIFHNPVCNLRFSMEPCGFFFFFAFSLFSVNFNLVFYNETKFSGINVPSGKFSIPRFSSSILRHRY